MATFLVTNLQNSGAGSFRQAIISSNAQPGPNTIDFSVTGTIRISRTSLPAITSPVNIDGTSAPSFAGSPLVTIDFHRTKGLDFAVGSDGSTLTSLSLVRASNSGVTLDASHITVQGNDIGVLADGRTPAGNKGDGVRINATSHDDLIGRADPVSGVTYYNTSNVSIQPVSLWQGLRATSTSGQYMITGTSNSNGLLTIGSIDGKGASYAVDFPGATTTSVYGPNDLGNGNIQLVGVYKNPNYATAPVEVNGFLFQGTTADLPSGGSFTTVDYPGAKFNYVHSTMGGLAVGNADGPEASFPLGPGHAFLYDIAQNKFLPDIVFPGSTSTTAYGIWYNGGTSYTIAGGYSTALDPLRGLSHGYMVDYDSSTGLYTHWTSFDYPNGLAGQTYVTHFEGISSPESGVYTLSADSFQSGSSNPAQGSWVTVRRNDDGSFGPSAWVNLNYPGTTGITSSNSVAGNQVVGIIITSTGVTPYQATVNTGFQLSNVISANNGNGIGIYGAHDNQIAMNNIGTDPTGTVGLGNRKNGILVTNGATRNLIGGEATGGNNPTKGVFVRPPQGNLISANGNNGVLITGGATNNQLSGNFVGTTASGNSPLGNRQDGVAIVGANDNQLIGCRPLQDPFVFYNVLSGNGGNGLRITNSNNTTVHANFFGTGANNATLVPNRGDGILVSGSSANTQVGGPIPLGNVSSGNLGNGVEIRDSASGFTSFNTFAGVYAFGGAAPNQKDGFLVTSTGGNNLIRTSIVSGNAGNGIELAGNATGVQITETAAGTNSGIQYAVPNQGAGIRIAGHAHNNAIGGFQPSIEPEVTVSGNLGNGIEIVGSAYNNSIFHTLVGTNASGAMSIPNAFDGIYLGPGTSGNTIGGNALPLRVKIANNGGWGVNIQRSNANTVVGTEITSNALGGVSVAKARSNVIGTSTTGNLIHDNGGDGFYAMCDVSGSTVENNDIFRNAGNGVNLNAAQGIIIGGSSPGSGNRILSNLKFGLLATGASNGSVVQGNVIANNTQGNVNISNATGLTFIP